MAGYESKCATLDGFLEWAGWTQQKIADHLDVSDFKV